MKSNILWILFISFFLLSSCKKELATVESFDFLPSKLEFDYLKIKSKMDYQEGNKSNKATIHTRIKKDSIIWMSIQHTIEAFRIVIRPDSVLIIDRLSKQFHALSYPDLQKRLGFELSYDFFESLITANVPDRIVKNGKRLKQDNMTYYLNKEGYYQFEYFVSESLRHLELIRVTEIPSNNSLTVNYDNYVKAKDNSIFPTIMNADINYQTKNVYTKSKLELEHSSFEVVSPEEALSFPFNIPDKYVRK
jgi:hypothetical protein